MCLKIACTFGLNVTASHCCLVQNKRKSEGGCRGNIFPGKWSVPRSRQVFPSRPLDPVGEHLPFELLVDIFTVASFISLLHPPLRRNSGPLLDSCSPQRGANIHEAAVVGWLRGHPLSTYAPRGREGGFKNCQILHTNSTDRLREMQTNGGRGSKS